MKGIIEFLIENPRPSDEEHTWAKDNGYTPEEVEEFLYELIGSMMKKMSKAYFAKDEDFDADQLKRGIEVEKEHTDNEFISKLIGKTHLLECPDFYTYSDRAEKQCKKDVKARALARLDKTR